MHPIRNLYDSIELYIPVTFALKNLALYDDLLNYIHRASSIKEMCEGNRVESSSLIFMQ